MASNNQSRASVGVVGGSGYTGREVLAVLGGHTGIDVRFATSRSEAGRPTSIDGLRLADDREVDADGVDVLFLCVPHGHGVPWVDRFRGSETRVVDLTADHRPGSGREDGAVYGLPEVNARHLSDAELVANPGCYPTGVILSLLPLLDRKMLDLERAVVVDAASGVTGAGRSPKRELLFAEVFEDFRAYALGNAHRHLAEMRALLPGVELVFTPHLLPVPRGIVETIQAPVRDGVDAAAVRAAWRDAYEGQPAVAVVEDVPGLGAAARTDRLLLGAADVAGVRRPLVTVVAAFDNLGKGAAGQAVQNMNLLLGFESGRGLRC